MFLSLNWLREFADLPESAEIIGEHLTLLGFEVEQITYTGLSLPGVVVGRVLEAEKHPNADRLRVCRVDLGDGTPVQIVCGAPNVAAGQLVPVATVGTVLPAIKLPDGSPLVIKSSTIRGQLSQGMICAEDELGLGNDHSGILVLSDDEVPGTRFDKRFDTDRDAIIEISLTPNRPDVSNHLGAARELAAKLNRTLKSPGYARGSGEKNHSRFNISVEATADCHRYQGISIRNVRVGPSPEWLKKMLEKVGVRSINNVVDATNYVMMAVGQPLHAFDADKLTGSSVVVKTFPETVVFETLDHVKRDVPAGSLFICDAEKPIALAGLMGGLDPEVSDQTVNILLESAYFNPVTIRKTSRLLSLRSEASYRFERGIDPENTENAGWLCARLITSLAGGEIEGPSVDIVAIPYQRKSIVWRPAEVNRILGTSFTAEYSAGILNRLELKTEGSAESMTTLIPGFRPDIEREIDLIEEIARVYDYNRIPEPQHVGFKKPDPIPTEIKFITALKETAVRLGLHEIYTNSLHPDAAAEGLDLTVAVKPLNPITSEQAVLRTSLLPGMLKVVAFNENRGARSLALFETGRVFQHSAQGRYVTGIDEQQHVALIIAGRKTEGYWNTKEADWTIFDAKALVMQLLADLEIASGLRFEPSGAQSLNIVSDKQMIGKITAISAGTLKSYGIGLPVFQAEMNAEVLAGLWAKRPEKKFIPLPKYPGVEFDIAFSVDISTPAEAMTAIIRKAGGALVQSVSVFDIFTGPSLGENRKSIAYRIKFLDITKTLTLNDIQPIIDEVVKLGENRFNAVLRK